MTEGIYLTHLSPRQLEIIQEAHGLVWERIEVDLYSITSISRLDLAYFNDEEVQLLKDAFAIRDEHKVVL